MSIIEVPDTRSRWDATGPLCGPAAGLSELFVAKHGDAFVLLSPSCLSGHCQEFATLFFPLPPCPISLCPLTSPSLVITLFCNFDRNLSGTFFELLGIDFVFACVFNVFVLNCFGTCWGNFFGSVGELLGNFGELLRNRFRTCSELLGIFFLNFFVCWVRLLHTYNKAIICFWWHYLFG